MENSKTKRIELSKAQQDLLIAMPETGMGYQIVDITMKNGVIYKDKTVLNGQYLISDISDNIEIDLIENIEISSDGKQSKKYD
jgi:hypothetical protein